jgi:hypothetical protein
MSLYCTPPTIARNSVGAVASIILLGLSACKEESAPADAYDITVYESRGLQCEIGTTPQQSGLKLIQQGIDVRRSGCGVLTNIAVPALCGIPDVLINLHVIPSVNLDAAERIGFFSVDTLRNEYDWLDCETRSALP